MRELTSQQLKAAILIGGGEKKKVAAKKVGVSPQTISYWGREDEFKELVGDIKREMMIDARNRLRSLLPMSLDNLESIIISSSSDAIKLKAIKLVLDQAKITFPTTGLWDMD